jgi:hypothetical protein
VTAGPGGLLADNGHQRAQTPRVLRIRVHRETRHRDVAVDGDLPLAALVRWLSPGPVCGVLDGRRPLELTGPGLRAQGVVDGADVTIVEA